jgi:hypothetical protein
VASLVRTRTGERSDRDALYSPGVSKVFISFVIVVVFGAVLFFASVVQNHGCMPWQDSVTVGGSVFSETDRGRTYCR